MRRCLSLAVRALVLTVFASALSVSASTSALAQQRSRGASVWKTRQAAPKVRFTNGSSALKIPLELDGNIIYLRVSVNGSKPLRFLFDTASSVSVISELRAAELGLKAKGQVRGNATGGAIQLSLLEGVSLGVPGAEAFDQLMASMPCGTAPCSEFDGVIGYDFINQFVVEVDYRGALMNLYDPRTYAYGGGGEVIPLSIAGRRTPLVHTLFILEGRAPVGAELEVDTAADGTFVINSPFVKRWGLLQSIPKTVRSSGVGAGGGQELLFGRAKAARLGRFTFENPIVGLSLDTEGSGASEENDGVIGGEILRRFKLIMDYSRRRMILEPNESFKDPYSMDMNLDLSGLTLACVGDDCKAQSVERVANDGPAAEAGLRVGDVITAIDERPIASLSSAEREQVFKQAGKELTLTVRRGASVMEKKIRLRSLP